MQEMQGALTRPGERSVQAQRAKPSTATERAGATRQTFHGHGACRRNAPNLPRPQRTRDKRATGKAAEKAKPPSL